MFQVTVMTLAPMQLPKDAYFVPRKRYRSAQIITSLRVPKSCTHILALTAVDISTTKGNTFDYGIIGQAEFKGRRSVLSSYRLKQAAVDYYKYAIKSALHEIGHMFGAPHHPSPDCLMSAWDRNNNHESVVLCPESKRWIQDYSGIRINTEKLHW
jgi:archaemetzincin